MLITCDNKGCLKTTDAQLDVETKEVVCLACEKPVKSVSESMKRVLKSSGQIVRKEVKKAFTMACMQCYANREVVLNSKNETVCSVCHHTISVHASMRLAMEETGTKLRKLLPEEETSKNAPEDKKTKKSTKKNLNKKQ